MSNVVSGYSLSYHIASAAVVWIGSDFYEFAYHRLGHISFPFWKQHKHHHVFFNPSPFAVIADEWIDQVRIIVVRIKSYNRAMLFFKLCRLPFSLASEKYKLKLLRIDQYALLEVCSLFSLNFSS